MNPNICYYCGGELYERGGRLVCSCCGTYMSEQVSNEETEDIMLLYTAFQKLRLADFYEAEREFDDIVRRYPRNALGYWGRLMSRYGIKYEKDYDGKCIPTCYATSIESILESSDYRNALKYADEENRAVFKEHAGYMERVRKEWLDKASREKPYDIFISFKDSDEEEKKKGRKHTQDSDDLRELYLYLMKKGYRVFFSRESLEGKGGEKYEPYIYAALSTAKVMLVYGSKPEYINATWVKNEWTRYQKRISAGEKHPDSLIVAYMGFSPRDLPMELSAAHRQHLDASKHSFYNEFLEAVERIISESRNIGKQKTNTTSKKASEQKKAISALHEHSYKITVVKATCVSKGYTLHQCACGEEYRDNYTDLAEHQYKVTNRIEPTCKADGKEEETCEICGQKQTKALSSLGHQFSKWKEVRRPTCTENGEEQRTCLRCSETQKKSVEKTGHSFGEWVRGSGGIYKQTCKNCGETHRNSVLPEEARRKKSKRRRMISGIFILLLIVGLVFSIKPMIRMAYEKSPFVFVELTDGTYEVSSVKFVPEGGMLEIPKRFLGRRITSIGKDAFKNCDGLTSMFIPDSVTNIRAGAFEGCENLSTIRYDGYKEDFASIKRENGWNQGGMTNTVVCLDGEAILCEIEWNLNGGVATGEMPFEYISGISISIPEPEYALYSQYNEFAGWYLDAACTQPFQYDGASTSRKITLYAKWNLCTVYAGISQTPDIITDDRAIIDWSYDTNDEGKELNFSNNVKKAVLIGNPHKVYKNTSILFSDFKDNQEVSLSLTDFNYEGFSASTEVEGLCAMTAVKSGAFVLNLDIYGNSSIKTTGIGQDSVFLKNTTLNIAGNGNLTVRGADGSFMCYGDQHGGSAVNVKKLYLKGSVNVNLIGGNGDVASSAIDSAYGGSGLTADYVVLKDALVSLTVVGGNGGNAYNRPSGDNDGDGSNGKNGYTGGNGGCGISAREFILYNGSCVVQGGNGGRGGDGSEGNGNWFSKKHGGNGGNGGNGGYGVAVDSLALYGGNFRAVGGNGGNGGSRGGMHEGNYGDAGSQGKGGSGGSGTSYRSISSSNDATYESFVANGANGSLGTGTNQS